MHKITKMIREGEERFEQWPKDYTGKMFVVHEDTPLAEYTQNTLTILEAIRDMVVDETRIKDQLDEIIKEVKE